MAPELSLESGKEEPIVVKSDERSFGYLWPVTGDVIFKGLGTLKLAADQNNITVKELRNGLREGKKYTFEYKNSDHTSLFS